MVSITFARPEYLWFLLALPLLVVSHFYLLRHARHKALKFANFKAIKRASGQRLVTRNYALLALRLALVASAILAVAQTTIWYEGETNENEYVITIDTSASMAAEDIPPTRLAAAKEYAGRFVDELDPQTRVGLVSFSGVTFIEQPLTKARGDLHESLRRIEIEASGTDLQGAIITSTNLATVSERGRAVILITDGSNTIETFQSRGLQRASEYAVLHRVKVYAIGIGTDQQSPIGYLPSYYNVSATYNEENLEFLANATGGRYYRASDETELERAYSEIKAQDQTSRLSLDLTPGLLLVTLALIFIEWGLVNTRFRLLP